MAVFLTNVCKYNGCGITFPSLSDLISHIEDTHIDYDPKVVEQKEQAQPACLPLSYILRFYTEDNRKEAGFLATHNTAPPTTNSGSNNANHGTGNVELKRKLAIKHHSYSMSSSNRSTTPTGSEMDEDEMVVTESEDSNDSWTTEEFSSEFIMRYGSRHSGGGSNGTPGNEKPFACPVPGCKKRYKNVNGIKYHSKNGHKKDGRVRKGYKCHCGKSYKTAQGLKNHALHTHNSQPDSVLSAQLMVADGAALAATNVGSTNSSHSNSSNPPPPVIQRSNSPSQSIGSLSPSSISNMSSSTSSCHGGSSSLSNGNTINGSNGNTAAVTSNGSVLQQLSAGNVVTLTNVSNHQQQQQPQQILQNGGPSATETSYSCSPNHNNSNHSSSDSSSKPPSASPVSGAAKRSIAIVSPKPPPLTAGSSQHPHPHHGTTPMQISPTFIEHKYSALAIKEKFFSNLRASKSMSMSSGGDGATIQQEVVGGGGGGLRTVAVGQMCAMQNEHIHQNLFKKTIN